MHKWGLGWGHPTCFHLQAKPGCKAESAEEKDYGTNPLCHLASTVQKSYSVAAKASFSDVLWLCNNQPPKNCKVFPTKDSQTLPHWIMLPSCGKYFLQVPFSLQLKKLNPLMNHWAQHLTFASAAECCCYYYYPIYSHKEYTHSSCRLFSIASKRFSCEHPHSYIDSFMCVLICLRFIWASLRQDEGVLGKICATVPETFF